LWSVLHHTPLDKIHWHLAFNQSVHDFHAVLGALCPDGVTPERRELPGGVERFQWTTREGMAVRTWQSQNVLPLEQLRRLLFHDVALETDYVICVAESATLEAGWWDALVPLLDQGIDYLGQPVWRAYSSGQIENIQGCSWYMGVPIEWREGRPGVTYLTGEVLAVRAERLREADFPSLHPLWASQRPPMAGDMLLGEIARQLGWKQGTYTTRGENSRNGEGVPDARPPRGPEQAG
jgi:hypothetical protein